MVKPEEFCSTFLLSRFIWQLDLDCIMLSGVTGNSYLKEEALLITQVGESFCIYHRAFIMVFPWWKRLHPSSEVPPLAIYIKPRPIFMKWKNNKLRLNMISVGKNIFWQRKMKYCSSVRALWRSRLRTVICWMWCLYFQNLEKSFTEGSWSYRS